MSTLAATVVQQEQIWWADQSVLWCLGSDINTVLITRNLLQLEVKALIPETKV